MVRSLGLLQGAFERIAAFGAVEKLAEQRCGFLRSLETGDAGENVPRGLIGADADERVERIGHVFLEGERADAIRKGRDLPQTGEAHTLCAQVRASGVKEWREQLLSACGTRGTQRTEHARIAARQIENERNVARGGYGGEGGQPTPLARGIGCVFRDLSAHDLS